MAKTFNRLDPIILEQQARYLREGLTYVSNDNNIIPRDDAGNIIMQEGSDTNPLLIIDPVTERISTKSALRVLDTRFQYFKFPVQVRTTSSGSVDIDLNQDLDLIFARYKPSENFRIPINPTNPNAFNTVLMDEIEEGFPQKNNNSYYITKEIKNSGKDLRFRIKLQHRYDSTGGFGTAYFSLMKSGPNYDLNMTWANISDFSNGEINQYEVQTQYFDRIIRNSEFEIGDNFSIGALVGQDTATAYHTVNSEQSYWVISDASKNVDEWNQEI